MAAAPDETRSRFAGPTVRDQVVAWAPIAMGVMVAILILAVLVAVIVLLAQP